MSAQGPPALAEAIFGDRLPLAIRFAGWLVGAGVERGLIGPHEPPRLWDRHLVNCAAAAALIAPGSHVVDIGSGAGLPGVVLAIARPDLRITLVESMIRRTSFLEVVVADLDLDGVEIRRARAEELKKPRLNADVVTARAVAPIDRLGALAAPLLRLGGCLLAIKGAGVSAEMAAGWQSLRRLSMADRASLYALVASATGARTTDCWLPGVEAVAVATWGTGGSVEDPRAASNEPSEPPGGEVPLAHVLRLERGGHGVSHPRQTGLG